MRHFNNEDIEIFSPNELTGLTAYNNDGLELFIHKDGSVYASKRAMARMLETPLTTVDKALKAAFTLEPVVQAQVHTGGQLRCVHLHGTKTLVALAKKYNPDLMERFAEMGANVYLYQLAGYKVSANVEAPTKEPSQLEQAEYMNKILNMHIEQLRYLKDKPGLAAKLVQAHLPNTLDSKMDFKELCELSNIPVGDNGWKSKMAARVAQAYQNDTHEALPKVLKTYKSDKGKTQSRLVVQYNVSCVAYLLNAVSSI